MDIVKNTRSRELIVRVMFKITAETILLLLFLMPFLFINKHEYMAAPILLSVSISVLAMLLLLTRINKPSILLISIPLQAAAGMAMGIDWWIILAVSLFMYARLKTIVQDSLFELDSTTVLYTALFMGICEYFLSKGFSPSGEDWILMLLLLQVFVYTYGSFMEKWISGPDQSKPFGPFILQSLAFIGIFLSIVFGVIYFSQYFHNGVNGLLILIIRVLSFATIPIIEWVIDKLLSKGWSKKLEKAIQDDSTDKNNQEHEVFQNASNGEWLEVFFVLLVIAVVIITVYKYRHWKFEISNTISPNDEFPTLSKKLKNTFFQEKINRYHYSKAENKVRQMALKMNKLAANKSIKKKKNETFRDWVLNNRLHFPEYSLRIYERVRYGHETITKDELVQFETSIKSLKEEIKKRK
ncbi:hypothetical protein [Falsibacillus albus]|uniref:DUF4129 domain-containing protein n=1 Tax=Falsibacillus albus TaxID=2478915 RepID=A0A3L7K1X1_9BACI|nr:hypothetical protein [Falsibacillus albus]RLQ97087.1 hypothetical protein D9X91_02700 [Falsibacillus albus]